MSAALSLEHRFVAGTADTPVLLLLHGTGGGPDDLLGVAGELSPGSPVLAPTGPVSERGMARWFRRLAEGVFDHEDVIRRADQLADFVLAARERYDLWPRRLVAVGFSNGANIAAATVLLRPDALSEAALFAAMLPVPAVSQPPPHDLSGSRAFVSNSRRDPMAPRDSADALIALLQSRSVDTTTHWHDRGHTITLDGLRAAKDWLTAGIR